MEDFDDDEEDGDELEDGVRAGGHGGDEGLWGVKRPE